MDFAICQRPVYSVSSVDSFCTVLNEFFATGSFWFFLKFLVLQDSPRHLLHCWTYQHMGHLFAENRAVFAAGLVCIPTCVLQYLRCRTGSRKRIQKRFKRILEHVFRNSKSTGTMEHVLYSDVSNIKGQEIRCVKRS